jgi:hypothetical protein
MHMGFPERGPFCDNDQQKTLDEQLINNDV